MTAPLRSPDPIIVDVALGARSYDIVIGRGVVASLGVRIAALKPGAKVAIVTDATVAERHLPAVNASLAAAGVAASSVVVQPGEGSKSFENMPAYQRLKDAGMESCGLTQLASRTVGVPFVGLIAGCLVISELLRRLHGGTALEFATGSVSALQDIETGSAAVAPYAYGHVAIG